MELYAQTLLVLIAFFVAGSVKGVIGLGLPTVSLAILVTVSGLKDAIVLMIIPALATNLYQAWAGPDLLGLLKRLWPMMAMAGLGIFPAIGVLAVGDAAWLTMLLGVVLICYSSYSLMRPQLPPPGKNELWMTPVFGFFSGILSGLTGSFVVPGILYLQALGLKRDHFVQAMGICFSLLAIEMGLALAYHGLFRVDMGLTSIIAIIPAFVGMYLGSRIRKRLPEDLFRKVFFMALLALGFYLIWRSATAAGLL